MYLDTLHSPSQPLFTLFFFYVLLAAMLRTQIVRSAIRVAWRTRSNVAKKTFASSASRPAEVELTIGVWRIITGGGLMTNTV